MTFYYIFYICLLVFKHEYRKKNECAFLILEVNCQMSDTYKFSLLKHLNLKTLTVKGLFLCVATDRMMNMLISLLAKSRCLNEVFKGLHSGNRLPFVGKPNRFKMSLTFVSTGAFRVCLIKPTAAVIAAV